MNKLYAFLYFSLDIGSSKSNLAIFAALSEYLVLIHTTIIRTCFKLRKRLEQKNRLVMVGLQIYSFLDVRTEYYYRTVIT